MKKIFSFAVALALLVAFVPTTVASAASCTGTYVGTSTYTNDTIDSKVGGGYWAYDYLNVVVDFYEVDEGEYCVDVQHVGMFESIAGDSPQGTGAVGDGVTGDILGGFIAYVDGTPNPFAELGHYDYMCDANTGVCLDFESWRDILFDDWDSFSFAQWAWLYTATCPSNGEWYNADTGNTGDITGEPDFSCVPVAKSPQPFCSGAMIDGNWLNWKSSRVGSWAGGMFHQHPASSITLLGGNTVDGWYVTVVKYLGNNMYGGWAPGGDIDGTSRLQIVDAWGRQATCEFITIN